MALFNYASRELSAKIVYYGPGLSGKTTNIEMVHKILKPEQKGRLISLPTETDRTLFFDFLPLDLGEIKGFKVRFHLYTVPGQVFYNATRRLVLQGVDGVVFVADSQSSMMASNAESLKNLVDNLTTYGKKLKDLPFVMQFNKRDLKNIASVEDMNARLNTMRAPVYEGVAKDGKGVTETLVAVSRLVFSHLRKTLLLPGDAAEPGEPGGDAFAAIGGGREAEALEELSEIEEITAEGAAAPEVAAPAAPPGDAPSEFSFDGLGEIEIELPERVPEPAPEGVPEGVPVSAAEIPGAGMSGSAAPAAAGFEAGVSVDAEGGGLTFVKFENVFVSTEGFVMLPAVFMDASGNPIKIRIRISVEEDRG
jgi:signal recognition particle receptor subunit beta